MAVITVSIMKTLQNILDTDTLTLAQEEIGVLKEQGGWGISRNFWEVGLYEGGIIGAVGIVRASNQLAERVKGTLHPHLSQIQHVKEVKVYHYLWYPLSGINMHNDKGMLFGATIYLTPKWRINWGGLFVYGNNNNELQVNFPTYNSVVINDSETHHMVTPVSPLASYPRHTLQIWGLK